MCSFFLCIFPTVRGAAASLAYLHGSMRACVSAYVCAYVYLLLVLPLQVQSGLDITSCLLEGLSLGDLSRVVGTDPDHVSAQEDQHVGTDLSIHIHANTNMTETGGGDNMSVLSNMHMSHHKNTVNSA